MVTMYVEYVSLSLACICIMCLSIFQGQGCVIVANQIFAHRHQPSVLVQEISVVNHGVCTLPSTELLKHGCHSPPYVCLLCCCCCFQMAAILNVLGLQLCNLVLL